MKRIKEFMKRAIREIREDVKEMGKAQGGWTKTAAMETIAILVLLWGLGYLG